MLRLIENDISIASGISPHVTQPVDTPEDVTKVVEMLKSDPWFQSGYRR
jgi:CMP-2-keto-3-deoxyoctulosonic acid synthetase